VITRLSLRTRATVLLLAVLLVVTGVFGALALLGERAASSGSSAVRIQEFDNANHSFDEGMLDQETGVRGYALSGDRLYLEAYDLGRGLTSQAEATLASSAPPNTRGLLEAELGAAHSWQSWAATRITAVTTGGSGATVADQVGKQLFDTYRTKEEAVDAADAKQVAEASTSLTSSLTQQRVVRAVGWLIVVAALVSLAMLIFRSILRPLQLQARFVGAIGDDGQLPIPGLGRHDEVGRLATALAALRDTVRARRGLTEATIEVSGQADLDEVIHRGLRQLAAILDADEAICTVTAEDGRRVAGSYRGLFEPGELISGSPDGDRAVAEGTTLLLSAQQSPPGLLRDRLLASGYDSVIVLPMYSGGDAIGTVAGIRKTGRTPFVDDDAVHAEVLVPFIGAAIKVATLIAELRTANQVKSLFLANMSHELRTPLNAILGFSQVLAAGDFGGLNDRQQRYVAHIENSGRRLLDLINDILDLAKVEAGLMEVHVESVELAPVLLESRSEIERQASAKGVRLVYDLQPGLWVRAEARRLQQVILNLLSNAVKFTPEGGLITVSSAASAQDRVEVVVQDSGIGIPAEDLDRIFDEFAQVESEDARAQKGTGLGLSLSRRLTELMDGTLTVESEPGEGSSFTVSLPAEPATRASVSGELVLVVEDETPNREYLSLVLQEAGYRTVTAPSVDLAIRAIQREKPAAILLDILLPGEDGWTLVDHLKGDLATGEIPIIAVTATDSASSDQRAGLAAFMTKPVDREELIAAVRAALGSAPSGPTDD
jgi:signal transduction histidine kinase/CHASE3 domain sensor protein/ActR/RegA family two-component response regulator